MLIAGLLVASTLPAFADTTTCVVCQGGRDAVITFKIKSKLAAENMTYAKNISVETHNAVVTLKGVTNSKMEAAKAVEIAEATKGVQNVEADNLIVANSDQPLKDAYITAKIHGIFIKYNLTSPRAKNIFLGDVEVEVQQGVANLSGTVNYDWQSTKLAELAKSIEGVSQVNNTISTKK